MDNNIDSDAVQNVVDAINNALMTSAIIAGALFLFYLIAAIAIAKKAGYSAWWGVLFVLLPVINIILLLIFIIAKWPALKQRDEAVKFAHDSGLVLPSERARAEEDARRMAQAEADAQRRAEQARAQREAAERRRDELNAPRAGQAGGATGAAAAAPAPEATETTESAESAETPTTESPASDAAETMPAAKKPAAKKPAAKKPPAKKE